VVGDIVAYTDTDGDGTGVYLKGREGTWVRIGDLT